MAREPIHFPHGAPANLLRGALGVTLRRLACEPNCPGARECESRAACPYARMFEPSALAGGPSGLADWPRPFVFRAANLDGRTVEPGATFAFDLNLFDMRGFNTHNPAIACLVRTFEQLTEEGLGPGRGRASFTGVTGRAPVELSLDPDAERVERVCVRFVTPTELKGGPQLAGRPEFGILAARIRDRVSTLRALYDDGPLAIDFREFGERAARVRMTRCETSQIDVRRRSNRTGQAHSLGGFVGEAEYEGELAEFVPYLKAAKWTGVGRQTVWGKGELAIRCS